MTEADVLPPEPSEQGRIAIPLAKPYVTYFLLGAIVVVFLVESILGGSTRTMVLVQLGAQVNLLVLGGEYWRLFTSMFLHIGATHLLFNAWALYSLGRDVEAFYGSPRFLVIYVCSGLFGGLAYYLLGAPETAVVVSAGASGAIFGIIGAEVAYWLRNRAIFGAFSKQRLMNLAILVGINILFGATASGINNLAHMGGLVSGFLLALVLAPRYEVAWDWSGPSRAPRLVNGTAMLPQVSIVILAILLLIAGLILGDQRWAALMPLLRQ